MSGLTDLLNGTAAVVRQTDPTGWSTDEWDDALDALGTVSYEIVGLSARIRAARMADRVNGTPVEHPVKPLRQDPPPKQDPPPDPPPAKPGEGT